MGDEGVDQCAGLVSGAGMDDQASRLVENDEKIVLKDNVQRNILGLGLSGRGIGHVHDDHLPVAQFQFGLRRWRAIDENFPGFDQRLDAGARKTFRLNGGLGAQELVEPLACAGFIDLNFQFHFHMLIEGRAKRL